MTSKNSSPKSEPLTIPEFADPQLRAVLEDIQRQEAIGPAAYQKEQAAKQQAAQVQQQATEVISQLIAARHRAHLTQGQLADIVGMQQSNLARIESGRVSTTLHTVLTLAAALNAGISVKMNKT